MKAEAKRAKVTIDLALDEDEAIVVLQLAGCVAGDAPTAAVCAALCAELLGALERAGVAPPIVPAFGVAQGRLYALPLPAGVSTEPAGDGTRDANGNIVVPEPRRGRAPKFV